MPPEEHWLVLVQLDNLVIAYGGTFYSLEIARSFEQRILRWLPHANTVLVEMISSSRTKGELLKYFYDNLLPTFRN